MKHLERTLSSPSAVRTARTVDSAIHHRLERVSMASAFVALLLLGGGACGGAPEEGDNATRLAATSEALAVAAVSSVAAKSVAIPESPSVSNCGTGFALFGDIGAKFQSLGGCGNFLGVPTTSESGAPDGFGRFNHFVNWSSGNVFSPPGSGASNGSIYWTPFYGAWSVHGAIRSKWASLGWERRLGYPVTDEKGTPDGVGRYNHFNDLTGASVFIPTGSSIFSNASIYWTPWTGPHEVHGEIRREWAKEGWESGLGYPKSDEYACGINDRCSDFEEGTIVFVRGKAKKGKQAPECVGRDGAGACNACGPVPAPRCDCVPPSRKEALCPGDHCHHYVVNQDPADCCCYFDEPTSELECLGPRPNRACL